MKVVVGPDRCEGNMRCQAAAPEVFEVRDDDRAYVLIPNPDENLREKVERAARLCPRQAIAITEEA